jgi:hypothetical protein
MFYFVITYLTARPVPFEKALSVIISADESSKSKIPMFSRGIRMGWTQRWY